jgi:hypothetical protein
MPAGTFFIIPMTIPLKGLVLPQPRERELASPEAAAALVADLFD